MNLVIVESPTKARTISRFLGKDYEIKFSMGHVMDLPKSKLGVDVDNGFAPHYELISDKKKIIAQLKSSAQKADSIILATDPDREGEAIAAHVAELLTMDDRRWKIGVENRKSKIEKDKINLPSSTLKKPSSTFYHLPSIQRIVFHEITQEAIQEALKNPRSIDVHLVDAQTARRVLDRLVGYKLSPLLWRKVRRGLSAGRVQSVALRLIVEREREIEKFAKEKYFTVHAVLVPFQKTQNRVRRGQNTQKSGNSDNQTIRQPDSLSFPSVQNENGTEFELIEINGEKIELQKSFQLYDGKYKVSKTTIEKEEDAKKIIDDLGGREFIVSDVIQKEMRRSPQPPYTTSTLQQDASRRLGINGRRTMSLAQKLYEEGYITYHRTDSVAIAISAQNSIRSFVKIEYGDKYLPGKPRFYATRQKLAQEAHEAIRPTRMGELQSQISNLKSQIGESYVKLYELIWRRAVASQMADAIIESTSVMVDAFPENLEYLENQTVRNSDYQKVRSTDSLSFPSVLKKYRLKANGSVLVFDGFLKVNPQGLQDNKLPKFSVKQNLSLIEVNSTAHETLPPPRYNDASLIKSLEEEGIGRPSTYATIVSTIEGRSYIERDAGRFLPTAIGVAVNDFLTKNFSDIDDIPFTAQMEDELDGIANGEKEWVPMMKTFYTPFEKRLTEVESAERVKIAVEETDEKCPKCGSQLVIRTGRFGKFLACSTFPNCKFTKAFAETTNLTCPKDNGQIVIKKTRKGRRFYGCSNYPACTFAAWKLEEIKNTGEARP